MRLARSFLYIVPNLLRPPRIRSSRTAAFMSEFVTMLPLQLLLYPFTRHFSIPFVQLRSLGTITVEPATTKSRPPVQ